MAVIIHSSKYILMFTLKWSVFQNHQTEKSSLQSNLKQLMMSLPVADDQLMMSSQVIVISDKTLSNISDKDKFLPVTITISFIGWNYSETSVFWNVRDSIIFLFDFIKFQGMAKNNSVIVMTSTLSMAIGDK